MSDHTPTPWRAHNSGNADIWYLDRDPDDMGMIATVWGCDDRAEGNAKLIAKSVNEFAALKAELDDAGTACLEFASKHGLATGHGDTVADMIREFSAQIEKQTKQLVKCRAAIGPFAWYYDVNDCHERHDDDALEVPIKDLKLAAETFSSTFSGHPLVAGGEDGGTASGGHAGGKPVAITDDLVEGK